jgi:hypothetical protein
MYKYFLNPRQVRRSFSHIGPRFHNKGKIGQKWNHSGCPLNFFGKSIVFLGSIGIIINSADILSEGTRTDG